MAEPATKQRSAGDERPTQAEIVREYGPFPDADHVHGVTYDGHCVWFAAGEALKSFDPASGDLRRSLAWRCRQASPSPVSNPTAVTRSFAAAAAAARSAPCGVRSAGDERACFAPSTYPPQDFLTSDS